MLRWLLISNLKQSTGRNKRKREKQRDSGHKLLKEFEKERKEEYLSKLCLLLVIVPISHYPCPVSLSLVLLLNFLLLAYEGASSIVTIQFEALFLGAHLH